MMSASPAHVKSPSNGPGVDENQPGNRTFLDEDIVDHKRVRRVVRSTSSSSSGLLGEPGYDDPPPLGLWVRAGGEGCARASFVPAYSQPSPALRAV
jgi:hypothetical protein